MNEWYKKDPIQLQLISNMAPSSIQVEAVSLQRSALAGSSVDRDNPKTIRSHPPQEGASLKPNSEQVQNFRGQTQPKMRLKDNNLKDSDDFYCKHWPTSSIKDKLKTLDTDVTTAKGEGPALHQTKLLTKQACMKRRPGGLTQASQKGFVLVCLALATLMTQSVAATSIGLEIGNNDPSTCETIGEAMDMSKKEGGVVYVPSIYVAGKTTSKKLLYNGNAFGCFDNFFGFYEKYSISSEGVFTKEYSRVFNEVVLFANELYVIESVVLAKQMLQGEGNGNQYHVVVGRVISASTKIEMGYMFQNIYVASGVFYPKKVSFVMDWTVPPPDSRTATVGYYESSPTLYIVNNFRNMRNGEATRANPVEMIMHLIRFGTSSTKYLAYNVAKTQAGSPMGITALYADQTLFMVGINSHILGDLALRRERLIYIQVGATASAGQYYYSLAQTYDPAETSPFFLWQGFILNDYNSTDRGQRAYGISMPYDNDFKPWNFKALSTSQDQKFIFTQFDFSTSQPVGCQKLTDFVVSVKPSNWGDSFYLELMDTSFGTHFHKLYLAVSQTQSTYKQIGSTSEYILQFTLPAKVTCANLNGGQILDTTTNIQLPVLAKYVQDTLDGSTQVSLTNNPTSYKYGAACQGGTTVSHCNLVSVNSYQFWDDGFKFVYMVNTKMKAVSASDDDGISNTPGTLTPTNGGNTSIVIAGNFKVGNSTVSRVQFAANLFMVNKQYQSLVAQATLFVAISPYTDMVLQLGMVDYVECKSQSGVVAPENLKRFVQISETSTDLTIAEQGLAFIINPSEWSQYTYPCFKTFQGQITTVGSLNFYLQDQRTTTSPIFPGFWDSAQQKVVFKLSLEGVKLPRTTSYSKVNYVQRYMQTPVSSSAQQNGKLCINTKYYFEYDTKQCIGQTTDFDSLVYGSSYESSLSQKVIITVDGVNTTINLNMNSADQFPTRECTATDMFTLTTTPLYFDYDGSKNVFKLKQSQLVVNSNWQDSEQKIDVYLKYYSSLNPVPFSNGEFTLTLNNPSSTNVNTSEALFIQVKGCSRLYATPGTVYSGFNDSRVSTAPLLDKTLIFVQRRSDCQYASIQEALYGTLVINKTWGDTNTTLVQDITTLFQQPSSNYVLCTIKEWQVISTTTTVQLANTDPISIILMQPSRTDPLGPLQANLTFNDQNATQQYQFRIKLILRGTLSETQLASINNYYKTITLNIGSQPATYLRVRQTASSIATPPTDLAYFNATNNELVLIADQTTTLITKSINLNDLLEFYSDSPGYKILYLKSFKDSVWLQPTYSYDTSTLRVNPTLRAADSTFTPLLDYKFGGSQPALPITVYLKGSLSSTAASADPSVSMSIKFIQCLADPVVSNSSVLEVQLQDLDVTVNSSQFFSLSISTITACQGIQYYLSTTATGASQPILGVSIAQTGIVTVSMVINQLTEFYIVAKTRNNQVASRQVRVLPKPPVNITVTALYTGSQDISTTVQSYVMSVPCNCVSVNNSGLNVSVLIVYSNLTQNDVGSFVIQALNAQLAIVYNLTLTISKPSFDYQASATIALPPPPIVNNAVNTTTTTSNTTNSTITTTTTTTTVGPIISTSTINSTTNTTTSSSSASTNTTSPQTNLTANLTAFSPVFNVVPQLNITSNQINATITQNSTAAQQLTPQNQTTSEVGTKQSSSDQQQQSAGSSPGTNTKQEEQDRVQAKQELENEQQKEEKAKPEVLKLSSAAIAAPKPNPWIPKISSDEAKELLARAGANIQRPFGFKPDPKPEPVVLKINEVSRNGIIKIGFNQKLLVPSIFNNSEQHDNNQKRKLVELSQIDVNRDIMELMFLLNRETDNPNIEFYSELKEWTEDAMAIEVNFTNPLIVSKGIRPDQIILKVKNTDLFWAKNSNTKLQRERVYIQQQIPRQLPKGVSEDELIGEAKTAQQGMLALFIIQLLMQLVLKGSLDRLWNFFFTMQIICYLVIYDVQMPANTEIYMQQFTKLIEFDLVNPDSILQKITGDPDFKLASFVMGLAKSQDGKPSVVEELSFYLVIIGVALLVLVVMGLAYFTKKYKEKVKEKLKGIFQKLVFNGMIRSITIMYIKLCMSFGGQVQQWLEGNRNQTQKDKIVGLVMFIVLFGYPLLCFVVVLVKRDSLEKQNIKARIENLYIDISLQKKGKWGLAYYTIFLIRRIIFVAIPTFLWFSPYYQLQTLLSMTTIYIVFYGGVRPHSDRQRQAIEIINEVLIMIMNYHMVCFSEFMILEEAQFQMGYSFVACIGIVVVVNLFSLAYRQIRAFKMKKMQQKMEENKTIQGLKEKLIRNAKKLLRIKPKEEKEGKLERIVIYFGNDQCRPDSTNDFTFNEVQAPQQNTRSKNSNQTLQKRTKKSTKDKSLAVTVRPNFVSKLESNTDIKLEDLLSRAIEGKIMNNNSSRKELIPKKQKKTASKSKASVKKKKKTKKKGRTAGLD